MGLDLIYDADGTVLTHRFSQADWETISALRSHLPTEIDICFGVEDFGEPVRIRRGALKESASAIDRFLAANADLLPATYQFKLERHPVEGVPPGGFSSGGLGGIRLPNDADHVYSLWSGLNKLTLKKTAIGLDGNGEDVEERDLRGETEIVTESCGTIRFRRRAERTTLRRALRDIAVFAEDVTARRVAKTIC